MRGNVFSLSRCSHNGRTKASVSLSCRKMPQLFLRVRFYCQLSELATTGGFLQRASHMAPLPIHTVISCQGLFFNTSYSRLRLAKWISVSIQTRRFVANSAYFLSLQVKYPKRYKMFEGQISGSSDDGKPVVLKPTLACMCASPPAPAEVRMIREGHILSDSPLMCHFNCGAVSSWQVRTGTKKK